jgi:hypothetical protein
MDHVVSGKFKLGKNISSGSFGEHYLGELLPIPFQHLQKTVFFPIVCLRKRDANYAILVFLSILVVNVQTGEEVAVKLV